MIDYTYFNHQDFVDDISFRNWVYEPDSKDAHFWRQWILEHPQKEREVDMARSILPSIRGELPALSSEQVSKKVDLILTQIKEEGIQHRFNWFHFSWITAAVIALAIGLYFQLNSYQQPVTYTALTAHTKNTLKEIANIADTQQQIVLPDGSAIILLGKSKVSFPKKFREERREVYLSGEAFFQVAKNPDQPFFVYANGLVTKVLGTSFFISAYDVSKEVKVIVKSGKVSVFAQSDSQLLNVDNELSGMVLTPNQQAVLLRDEIRIIKSIVRKPDLEIKLSNKQNFIFDRTPVTEVFTRLEKAYGVAILFDATNLENCTITATLGNESLDEKLQLICTTIEASYAWVDKKIVIHSVGCR